MELNKCVIVVPIYKLEFDYDEYHSIVQLFNILGKYNIVAIYPQSLDLTYYLNTFNFTEYYSLWDSHFENYPYGYNALLMSDGFYDMFSEYEYMLIYQPDAWVFKDELEYWCNKGYDHIGAPNLYNAYYDIYIQIGGVGNGGFSLRKISWWKKNCKKYEYIKQHILSLNEKDAYSIGEDHFPILINFYENIKCANLPSLYEAMHFAWEIDPHMLFQLTDYKIPFGCHAYKKVLNNEIYKDIISYEHKKMYTYLTFIFGDYEILREPEEIDPLAEYVCITNNHNLQSKIWKFIYDENINNGNYTNWQRTLLARYNALNYCNTDICIILDGSVQIKRSCFKYINMFKNEKYDIGLMMHPYNDSYNDEFDRWINDRGLDTNQKYDFNNFMYNHNYDINEHGLIMITFFIQRNNEKNRQLNKEILDTIIHEMNFNVRVDQMYFTAIFMNKYYKEMKTYFMCLQVLYSKYFEFFYHNSNYSHKDEHKFNISEKKYYNIKNIETPVNYFL